VETEFEAGALLGQGWNQGQGWLFGKPEPLPFPSP
jgi:EAL domain-containing protein (putative c-di-GMP-specific phosphodiesterase class I)